MYVLVFKKQTNKQNVIAFTSFLLIDGLKMQSKLRYRVHSFKGISFKETNEKCTLHLGRGGGAMRVVEGLLPKQKNQILCLQARPTWHPATSSGVSYQSSVYNCPCSCLRWPSYPNNKCLYLGNWVTSLEFWFFRTVTVFIEITAKCLTNCCCYGNGSNTNQPNFASCRPVRDIACEASENKDLYIL